MLRAFVTGHADLSTAGTVFCRVFVQALPSLGLAVVVSGLITRVRVSRTTGALVAIRDLRRGRDDNTGPDVHTGTSSGAESCG